MFFFLNNSSISKDYKIQTVPMIHTPQNNSIFLLMLYISTWIFVIDTDFEHFSNAHIFFIVIQCVRKYSHMWVCMYVFCDHFYMPSINVIHAHLSPKFCLQKYLVVRKHLRYHLSWNYSCINPNE